MIPAIASTVHTNTKISNLNLNCCSTINASVSGTDFRRINGTHEQSTKNSTKDNMLDYTFLSHRSQISNDKRKEVNSGSKSKDYIFDLINTWELNLELLEMSIKETNAAKEQTELISLISSIKTKFQRKKELRTEVSRVKGKSLIEKQIIEEYKRKFEENEEYYKDQMKEFDENRENKEEYIKIFEKKLKEVEIYVQKNTKNLVNSKFEIYKDFKINDFVVTNTDLLKNRDMLLRDLNNKNAKKLELEEENLNFKNEMNFSFTEEPAEDIKHNIYNSDICCIDTPSKPKSSINQKSKDKLKEYYKKFRNKVNVIEMRTKLMRNYFTDLSSRFKYFSGANLKQYIIFSRKPTVISFNNVNEDGEEIMACDNNNFEDMAAVNDRSNLNFDMTRKISTMMDFSVILNKKSTDETNFDFGEGLNKTGLGNGICNEANDVWDISCIGK